MKTPVLTNLLEEVVRLEKRSDLLDFLLGYYKIEEKNFVIPEKWKSNIRADKLPAKNPRNFVLKKIIESLTQEEMDDAGLDWYNIEDQYNL